MLKNSAIEYGVVSKTLHWLMAAIILVLIFVGIYMAGLPKEAAAEKQYAFQFYNLHKSFGVVAFGLILLRLVWVAISPVPKLPSAFAPKERAVVKALQGLLYLLMLVMPISGMVMSNASGRPVNFFGLGELPALIAENEALAGIAHEVHEIMGWTLLVLIVLHMAGPLKHRLKDKGGETDVLKRML